MAGLDTPDQGSVYMDGKTWRAGPRPLPPGACLDDLSGFNSFHCSRIGKRLLPHGINGRQERGY